jgi:hypothetical protein
MLVNNKGYVTEYWMLNTIIDCGEISNKQDLDINISISQREIELMNDNEPEKLNKYLMNDNNININGNEYNEFNSNNRKCKNTKHPKSKRYNRNKNESNRMYTEQESYQHIYLQKAANKNCNKREMQYLSKNSRLYEFGGTQRKVMLDSFTKPILDKN